MPDASPLPGLPGLPGLPRLPGSLEIDAATRRVRLSPDDPDFVQNPYPAYRAIRAACPVFFWEQYGHWCAARHADVAALFRDRRLGREHPGPAAPVPEHLKPFGDFESLSLLEREPPEHTRLRGLVNRAFVSRMVERLRPRIATLAHRLIDDFQTQGRTDLLPAFAEPIPLTIIAEMLGVPVGLAPQLLDWSHRMVAMYQFGRSRAVEEDAAAAASAFAGFMRGLVAQRRGAPSDDIIGRLLAAEAGGDRLSEEELVATSMLLLNAGHEATVHAIGNAVACILASGLDPRPHFASPARLAALIEELLRIDPPLHLFTRYATQPFTFAGVSLAAGDRIGLLIGAANHDPEVFAAPDRLDPGRPARPHLAFGGGIHFCIGAPLARLELQVALPILFARLADLRLLAKPRYAPRFHFHGLESLPLGWTA